MQTFAFALTLGLAAAQSLNFPTAKGAITGLPSSCAFTTVGGVNVLKAACTIPSGVTVDLGNQEFDRGMACGDGDSGSANAVFILQNGATIRNGIIGAKQLEGIHCRNSCTVQNIWFRDVCEDAISALGSGTVTIVGGGAQNADDKVVQHNGPGRVDIRDYTVVNVGKVYRSCGNCSNNKANSPRTLTVTGLKANGVRTNVAGINSNFGDTATISGVCGTVAGEVCQQFTGLDGRGASDSPKIEGKQNCKGAQGAIAKGALPRC